MCYLQKNVKMLSLGRRVINPVLTTGYFRYTSFLGDIIRIKPYMSVIKFTYNRQFEFLVQCRGDYRNNHIRSSRTIVRNLKINGVSTKVESLFYYNGVFINPINNEIVGFITLTKSKENYIFVFDLGFINEYFKPLFKFDYSSINSEVIFKQNLNVRLEVDEVKLDLDKFNALRNGIKS